MKTLALLAMFMGAVKCSHAFVTSRVAVCACCSKTADDEVAKRTVHECHGDHLAPISRNPSPRTPLSTSAVLVTNAWKIQDCRRGSQCIVRVLFVWRSSKGTRVTISLTFDTVGNLCSVHVGCVGRLGKLLCGGAVQSFNMIAASRDVWKFKDCCGERACFPGSCVNTVRSEDLSAVYNDCHGARTPFLCVGISAEPLPKAMVTWCCDEQCPETIGE